jgi:hypothetical protein
MAVLTADVDVRDEPTEGPNVATTSFRTFRVEHHLNTLHAGGLLQHVSLWLHRTGNARLSSWLDLGDRPSAIVCALLIG